MFSDVRQRTLWIVKLHPDSTNDVSSPARKGNHYEEPADHRLRHLCPVPVSVWLTCGNERTVKQCACSVHGKHAERLLRPGRVASPTQSGVSRGKRSACCGSGSEKPATRRSSRNEAHQTASGHRMGARTTECMLAPMRAAPQPEPVSSSTSPSGSRQALVPMGSASFLRGDKA